MLSKQRADKAYFILHNILNLGAATELFIYASLTPYTSEHTYNKLVTVLSIDYLAIALLCMIKAPLSVYASLPRIRLILIGEMLWMTAYMMKQIPIHADLSYKSYEQLYLSSLSLQTIGSMALVFGHRSADPRQGKKQFIYSSYLVSMISFLAIGIMPYTSISPKDLSIAEYSFGACLLLILIFVSCFFICTNRGRGDLVQHSEPLLPLTTQ